MANPACTGAPTGGSPISLIAAGTAAGTNTFSYDVPNNRFVLGWDTSALATGGCYNLVLSLDDGTSFATMVHLDLAGFRAPLQVAGPPSSPSDSGVFILGTTIPVQWQLEDGSGNQVVNNLSTLQSVQAFSNPACSGAAPATSTVFLRRPVRAKNRAAARKNLSVSGFARRDPIWPASRSRR